MPKDRIFAEGFFYKEKETQFGVIPKLSFQVERFVKFLNEHVNDAGYVNIDVLKRREPDGDKTHYSVLDTFSPKEQGAKSKSSDEKPAKSSKPSTKKAAPLDEEEDDRGGW